MSGMVRSFLVWLGFSLVLGIAGCGRNVDPRMVGVFDLDRPGTLKLALEADTDEELASTLLKSMAVTYEFRSDGTFVSLVKAGPSDRTTEGTWEVVNEEERGLRVRLVIEEGGRQHGFNASMSFPEEGKLHFEADIVNSEFPRMVFQRRGAEG